MRSLIVHADESRTGQPLNVVGEQTLVKVGGAETGGAFTLFHLSAPPMSGPPMHRHSREDELFYVLDGELEFDIEGVRTTASAGTTVYAARGTVHTYQNFTNQTVTLLITVAPAGMEDLFITMSAAMEPGQAPDFALLAKLNLEYGIEILGPPLS